MRLCLILNSLSAVRDRIVALRDSGGALEGFEGALADIKELSSILALEEDAKEIERLFRALTAGRNETFHENVKAAVRCLNPIIGQVRTRLYHFWALCPNIIDDSVPDGQDERDNQEIETRVPSPPVRDLGFIPKQHHEIALDGGELNFKHTEIMAGARFVTLMGSAARLERQLANYMIEHAVAHGYTEVAPPYLVRRGALFGTGQWPNLKDDLYCTHDENTPQPRTEAEHERYYREASSALIMTGEVPLTNLVADRILAHDELPLRFVACTPCFRREAGSGGKDLKGMIRLHQFTKVELVSITDEENSAAEHERMLDIACELLANLGLPFRVVVLCSGDVGFSAAKTYDIEVWMPGQGKYREISSISNCRAFQALRMDARYKDGITKKNKYVHTLNGSALAVGRTMAALLENYQTGEGGFSMPPDIFKS
jgi:seryl-tRNA synthetase